LSPGASVAIGPEQAHYAVNVMRRRPGDAVFLFNGRDGEWRAVVTDGNRRICRLSVEERVRPQSSAPNLWLLFAPLKRLRLDWLIEKATELGVGRLQPVMTRHTVAQRTNAERLKARAVEAAEQCRRLTVPEVAASVTLDRLLAVWSADRRLLLCDFADPHTPPILDALKGAEPGPWAVFAGPEGGFAEDERAALLGRSFVVPARLGPGILRAETAAVAALSVWQAVLGEGAVEA